jgi:toxin CptA
MSLLLHGLVAAFVLLMPWPLSYTPLWLLLLSFVVFDSVRSQRLNARQGEIKLLMDSRLRCGGERVGYSRYALDAQLRHDVTVTQGGRRASPASVAGG